MHIFLLEREVCIFIHAVLFYVDALHVRILVVAEVLLKYRIVQWYGAVNIVVLSGSSLVADDLSL